MLRSGSVSQLHDLKGRLDPPGHIRWGSPVVEWRKLMIMNEIDGWPTHGGWPIQARFWLGWGSSELRNSGTGRNVSTY
jgi:hypothetical protein